MAVMGLSQLQEKREVRIARRQETKPRTGLTALAAGIVASVCCLLPLALIAVGAGTLGWGMMGRLSQYQWATIPIGIGLLGLAFYFYRSERRRCRSAGCPVPANSFKVLTLVVVSVVVGFAAAGALFPDVMLAVLRALS